MKNALPFVLLLATGLLAGCNKQPAKTTQTAAKNPCAGQALTYTADVKPILDTHCARTCHSAAKKARGIDLSTYAAAKEAAAKANFLGSIRHDAGFAPMPKNHPKLDDATIQKLTCWVRNGAAE